LKKTRPVAAVLSLDDLLGETFDPDDHELVRAFDELPLWSAPFGLALLDKVRWRPSIRALDVGCGTGFPLLEVAQRLGPDSHVVGIDPWAAAGERIRQKARVYRIGNVEVVQGVAEQMPFPDAHFQLIVSNNGLNNVNNPEQALAECARVSAPGAQLVFTANLPETMQEFYDVFADVLRAAGSADRLPGLLAHIASKRPTRDAWERRVRAAEFELDEVEERTFFWRFASGRALFRHGFIRLAFLQPWKAFPAPADISAVFGEVERRLDVLANEKGGLSLRIPFACYSCHR